MGVKRTKIIVMLWSVISVLVLGGGVLYFLAMQKLESNAVQINDQNDTISSLRDQLKRAAQPTSSQTSAQDTQTGTTSTQPIPPTPTSSTKQKPSQSSAPNVATPTPTPKPLP